MTKTRIVLWFAFVATTVGCDRVTKRLATASLEGTPAQSFLANTVRLEYAENTGGFLSIGANLPPAVRTVTFTIGTALILSAVLIVTIKNRWMGWNLVASSLVFGGGASNLLDRITRGAVVDFLNIVVGNLRTGVFNVADMAVFLGICILLVSLRPGSS